MSCAEGKHELRAVLPFVHPTAVDHRGDPLEVIGHSPRTQEEPAWCIQCGALWCKRPLVGWGFLHPMSDRDAPTLGNMVRNAVREGKVSPEAAGPVTLLAGLARGLLGAKGQDGEPE